MKTNLSILTVLIVMLLIQLACSTSTPQATVQPSSQAKATDTSSAPAAKATPTTEKASPTETSVAVQSPTATQAVAAATPTAPASTELNAAPGIACFGSYDFGLTCFDGKDWKTYSSKSDSLTSDMILDVTTCPDQRILAATPVEIGIFDGKDWKLMKEGWGDVSPDAVACDAKGGIWVAHYQGASYFDGNTWTTYASKDLATGDAANDLVDHVAVSPDGTTWVQTSNSIAAFKDGNWTIYQKGQGFDDQMYFSALTLDPKGNPWVATSSGLATFNGKEWIRYDNYELFSVEAIAVEPGGRVWVGTYGSGLYLFENGAWQHFDQKDGKISSNHIRSVKLDENGRVWVSTAYGLDVFDGKTWQVYRMDNSGIFDNDIRRMVVLAGGPQLPQATDNGTGSISGQFVDKDGNPLSGVDIEICVEVSALSYTDTPCEGQPLIKNAKADADGKFEVDDLPVGLYMVTAKAGDKWLILVDDLGLSSERVMVRQGKNNDLGKLKQSDQ